MPQSTSRRDFLGKSAKAGIASIIALPAIETLLQSFSSADNATAHLNFPTTTGFDQTPLPYAYNALEPNIDALTMEIHYTKHAAAYSKNLKEAAAAEKVDTNQPVEELLTNISKYSTKVRNNGGGHFNHELFWKLLSPTPSAPSASLADAINKKFGSMDEFKKQFTETAKSRFGSGWAWLILNKENQLAIVSTPNQDNPLMDIAETKGYPLIALDVWEHAYYLKYHQLRADYIGNFWKILNWDLVSERYKNGK